MPKYEYDCPSCGLFADFRPLAEYDLPLECPTCGAKAPRAVLCLPALSSGSAAAERRNAPQFAARPAHSAGCRCCGGGNFKISRKEWTSKLL